jgi:hypothetical protein
MFVSEENSSGPSLSEPPGSAYRTPFVFKTEEGPTINPNPIPGSFHHPTNPSPIPGSFHQLLHNVIITPVSSPTSTPATVASPAASPVSFVDSMSNSGVSASHPDLAKFSPSLQVTILINEFKLTKLFSYILFVCHRTWKTHLAHSFNDILLS